MLSNISVPSQIYLFHNKDLVKKLSSTGNKLYSTSHVQPYGTKEQNAVRKSLNELELKEYVIEQVTSGN